MAARRWLGVIAISGLFVGTAAYAQESAVNVPAVQNSKYQFEGTINADAVLVRAGPSDNYYPIVRLDKGTTVTVVGISFDWLKIAPPEGSFSYVSKAYVNKTADGKGSITRPSVNIRAGSSISPMKSAVQTKLGEGDTVEIIGEQDEYYKIKPPAGAYLYVNKQFVTPGKLLGENPVTPVAENNSTPTTASTEMAGGVPTTQSTTATPTLPTTRYVLQSTDAENKFAALEEKLMATRNQSLDQQPIAELLSGYQSIVSDPQLPTTLQGLAQNRIDYLKDRQAAQQELAEAKKTADQLAASQKAMQEQQQQLEQKLAQQQMHVFAAVGTLQSSTVQESGASLYRLTDPGTGRTLVYVRPSDSTVAGNLGQLVGVRGQISDDPSLGLKIISPTGIEPLSSDELSKVTADIMPANTPATQP